ncbi:flagellar filament capping protein FliD [Paenibacillus sp. HB172176]|uniref:flagellar filament capping protein FliD n=1 Tax=Paenibacillus sp. HB172176 TaxID=2493690 RepID=UPI0014389CD3|nr:flagellar filament capping protein FliD [Paenibacillus sp. HB172176]
MSIRISGLASGIDTDTMVKQLMAAARLPMDKLVQKQQTLEWKRDSYRELNNKILDFKNAAFDMKLQSGYLAKKVSSSLDSVVSVTGSANANEGQYTFEVVKLAKAAGFSTGALGAGDGTATIGEKLALTGTDNKLTIAGAKGTAEITLDEDYTLNEMIANINSKSNETGVKAAYDSTMNRIFFTTTQTGEDSKIDLTLTNSSGTETDLNSIFNMSDTNKSITGEDVTPASANTINIKGLDATIKFNGIQTTYPSNTMTIAGLTFTAKQESTEIATVEVSQDIDSIVDKIKNFVDKYNSLISDVDAKVSEKRDRDYAPLTDAQREEMSEDEIKRWEEKAKAGMLSNDSILSGGMNALRRVLTDTVGGLPSGQLNSLAAIGISNTNIVGSTISGSYADGGKLYIDETKLKAALADNPDEVMALFTTDVTDSANDGIAAKLYDKASNLFQQITDKAGASTSIESNYLLGKENLQIADQITSLTTRLQDLEDRYYKQFTAMETYINQMNSQSNWLAQQFSTS